MKLTNKQKKALNLVEWFIPKLNWNDQDVVKSNASFLGLGSVDESDDGVNSDKAFFDKSERGITPKKVNNLSRFVSLIFGQRWMATHEKMWKEGRDEGTCLPTDFLEEPDYVKEFVYKKVFGLPIDWKPR